MMLHVFPNNELMEHDLGEHSSTCKCGTRVIFEKSSGEMIVVHTSLRDGSSPTDEEIKEMPNDEAEDILGQNSALN